MNDTHPSDALPGGLPPEAYSTLLRALHGLHNRRALVAMLGSVLLGVLVAGAFWALAMPLGGFMAFLGSLVLLFAAAIGINAAGVLLMDQARGLPSRSLGDALKFGLACIPKIVLLSLVLVAIGLAVFVALAIAYLLCKIPYLGPVLFVVVFPLSVVIAGLTVCGLLLCLFLALPAIWQGAGINRAVAQALAIVRSRLVESILMLVVVWLLSMVVGAIVFGILLSGLMPSLGLSVSILGGDSFGMMMRGPGAIGTYDGAYMVGAAGFGSGHAVAAGIGAALLFALAGSLVWLVYLLGLSLVYLRVTEGLDPDATEGALRAGFGAARSRAADFGRKTRDAAERAREQALHAAERARVQALHAAERARVQARHAAGAAQSGMAAAAARARVAMTPAPKPPSNASEPAFDPAVTDPATVAHPGVADPPAADSTQGAADPALPKAPAPPVDSPAGVPPAASRPGDKTETCPQCTSPVAPQDRFCGVCGHRLK